MAGVRADAHRNRERLLASATAAFAAANGTTVSLEAIARDARVGIGTLYRHFPSREALVEAVYRTELAEVSASADELLEHHSAVVALGRWMTRYSSFVAAKQGMAASLSAMFTSGAVEPGETRTSIVGAIEALLKAGAADGSLRSDVSADDVVASLIGIVIASQSTAQANRMRDLLIDGLVATR